MFKGNPQEGYGYQFNHLFQIIYEGEFKNGLQHGKSKEFYEKEEKINYGKLEYEAG